jgi:hypothetical protein
MKKGGEEKRGRSRIRKREQYEGVKEHRNEEKRWERK